LPLKPFNPPIEPAARLEEGGGRRKENAGASEKPSSFHFCFKERKKEKMPEGVSSVLRVPGAKFLLLPRFAEKRREKKKGGRDKDASRDRRCFVHHTAAQLRRSKETGSKPKRGKKEKGKG